LFRIENWPFFMRLTLIIAALIVASPALATRCAQGQFFRVRLDKCVSFGSPLARPYAANAGKKIDTPPEPDPLVTVDPPFADPPPSAMDEAAWRTMPLLRAVADRWAVMVSPPRQETPAPAPWPWLSIYGLRNSLPPLP